MTKSPAFLLPVALSSASICGIVACESRLDLGRNEARNAADDEDSPSDPAPDASTGDDATSGATTCTAVCARMDSCGMLTEAQRDECVPSCFAETTSALRACIMQTPCAEIVETCRPTGGLGETDPGDTFEVEVCRDRCDSAKFHDCLTAAEHSRCRERCASASASARESFTSCIEGSGTRCPSALDCYTQFSQ